MVAGPFRLWLAKWGLGPKVGEWQVTSPRFIEGRLQVRRLRENGNYDWRDMTDEEVNDYVENIAW